MRFLAAALAVLLFLPPATTAQGPAGDPAAAERVQTWLRANSRPAIAVLPERPQANHDATSWLGGLPRLPEEMEWPRSGRGPMFFMAQIDLADLPEAAPRGGLPSTGVLWFFAAYDDAMEQLDVAAQYDPRSHRQWPERRPPRGTGRIADVPPYVYLPETDSLAQLDLRRTMRFAAVDSYRLNSATLYGPHVSEGLDAASNARRAQIESALGRPTRPGPRFGAPQPLDDNWPYAGLYAELASRALADQLPGLDISRYAPPGSSWTREGRALRARIAREAEQQARRWRAWRYHPLSAEERAEFRAWLDSVKTRSEAMPRTQTGGNPLVYHSLGYVIRDVDTFAALAMSAEGADSATLPPDFRASFDWFGDAPPMHQMLGYGFSWQDGPVMHVRDVLLLQIEGGPDTPWLPECILHVWITPEALTQRRFDQVSTTLECD